MQEQKKFWQGTNFWFAAIMVLFSFFGGTESLAQNAVSAGVGIVALIGSIRQFLPNAIMVYSKQAHFE